MSPDFAGIDGQKVLPHEIASRFVSMAITRFLVLLCGVLVLGAAAAVAEEQDALERLGEKLFFDVDLSLNRSQSCATCHMPDRAFTDGREMDAGRAASLGDDGTSLGDRNAPTVTYARLAPYFGRNERGRWKGGLFHDGRAASLEEQAAGPPLNPIEMGMPSKAAVVARLKEKPETAAAFERVFGADVFADDERAFAAMTKAIAAFERTAAFSPFDSKYDRSLRGEATLSPEEELGRVLFFSNQFTNCSKCHRLNAVGGGQGETFSNYEFHNIGVPVNEALRKANGSPAGRIDQGLAANPAVGGEPVERGKFKTPSLRNVAVTAPYMHNGAFADLHTVILFYNKYNSKSAKRQINPETGAPWAAPEVEGNLSLEELQSGPALKDREIAALVAFLRTLTDRRYEHLLAD
jgi:cytochrome c peroxidase